MISFLISKRKELHGNQKPLNQNKIHMALIFNHKKPYNILSYGENIPLNKKEKWSIHAEINAMNKLKPQDNLKDIDILIIKLSKTYTKLSNSRPCCNCV